MLKYVSTRGAAPVLGFGDVLLTGLAADGGLYVPGGVAGRSTRQCGRAVRPYDDVAVDVMWPYVEGSIDRDELDAMVADAYATFDHPEVCPVVELGEARRWHPTRRRAAARGGTRRSTPGGPLCGTSERRACPSPPHGPQVRLLEGVVDQLLVGHALGDEPPQRGLVGLHHVGPVDGRRERHDPGFSGTRGARKPSVVVVSGENAQ